jgi:predicted branched-subunit amino acid permease
MYFDFALIGFLLALNAILVSMLTYKHAKNKTDHQMSVVLVSLILSLSLFPLGWIHCWHWSKKLPDRGFIKLD